MREGWIASSLRSFALLSDLLLICNTQVKQPAVYIVANKRNGTLYTGVTSDLPRRAFEHREGLRPGFTRRYGCKMLVWYQVHDTMLDAIAHEKQIKAGSRRKKIDLIETMNPDWRDLFDDLR